MVIHESSGNAAGANVNSDLICVASTIADTAESANQQGTFTELLPDLIILFAGAMRTTLHELTVQVQLTECDTPIHQQADR